MSLPIIRLRTVNSNHATAADDPVTASCTLYGFLRSVPSRFECDMAMSDFKRGVQAAQGQTCLTKNNANMLNLVFSSVQDRLLRELPKIIPQLARNSSTWRRLLSGVESTSSMNSTPTATRLQDNARSLRIEVSTQPSIPSTPLPSAGTGENGNKGNHKNGDHHSSAEEILVEETVSTTSTRFKSPYELIPPPIHLTASEHKESRATGGMQGEAGERKDASTVVEHRGKGNNLPGKGYRPHPLLLAILERVRSSCSAEENESDREEREFTTIMESREKALRTKLSSAYSMIPPEEKNCMGFLRDMEARVAVAQKLFEVQKFEETTIRMTECALKVEVATMRALLHQIVDAVAEAEERHEREGPRSPYYAEECHVMAAIQQALDDLAS
ncbi:hypothetical protein TcG_00022 [Trypanosoma cruzi]|uniref:Uncharacterized protein n=2 Tax=Trypanosoma cruzi TaxID=5693 RepID=V5B5S1_TRYCR|nr:hypothetical protein TCDM_02729 [Trypanosoma cruzi Dm28c]KAF8285638.1 hypothetical protein TcBrA4_0035750 [Trypanosoma cruzi]PBJ80242.1 hypothetical protein BCY84_01499 [Trypanosoma cruzi cruzi]PWU96014.1 hypothetical protein C4B63_20g210 [Trypanosoma cruzi]RNF25407.1 hypothetical protein TcG_00022 [Trypanosoma cruzi]